MQSGYGAFISVAAFLAGSLAVAQHTVEKPLTLTGSAAYGDWRGDRPCLRRKITPADMPAPKATPSADNVPKVVKRPDSASPTVPPGFKAELFEAELAGPRVIRVAPNGDIFVAESETTAELAAFEKTHGVGAAWGYETNRADVLAYDPQGREKRVFATGLRNCSGLAVRPEIGDLWCAINERDQLGDELPPDFVTRVEEGRFYGWPWFYIGPNVDPRHKRPRPDLVSKITVPDVLIQPHSAPLGLVFYEGSQFPPKYKGSAFVALHGSWNRAKRTGYKVIRVIFENGAPNGEYEDFLLGFVLDDNRVWGRPVNVAVAQDGSLLVAQDGNGTIWRVVYSGDAKTCD